MNEILTSALLFEGLGDLRQTRQHLLRFVVVNQSLSKPHPSSRFVTKLVCGCMINWLLGLY